MTTAPDVLFELTNGLATVTLSAPQRRNAMGLALLESLADAVARCSSGEVRAVLLRGVGPTFSVGGDLREFVDRPVGERNQHVRAVANVLHRAVLGLNALEVPVVGVATGNIAGAGVSLLCSPDLVVAAADATFTLAYTAIGYTPDGGASWLLPRLIGERRALELLLTNRRLTAAEALDWGLVNAVVDPSEIDSYAADLASRLGRGPIGAFGGVKRLIRSGATTELAPALEAEAASLASASEAAEGVEGSQAFLAKRAPQFVPPIPR